MPESEIHSKEFGQVRQKFAEMIRKKGNENLANTIETSTAANLSDKKVIQGWKQLHSEFKVELETLREEIIELHEEGTEKRDPSKYFRDPEDYKNFVPEWLAAEIEEDYEFRHLIDSNQLFVFKNGYFQDKGRELIREEVNERLQDHVTRRRVKEVTGIIEDRCFTERSDFRPPRRMINFENGVYDLDSEELVEHSPKFNFSYKIPHKYPENPPDCNKINQFLESLVRDDESVKTLKEIAGYLLLPDYPINKAFILVGQGSNGKSKYLDLLKNILGEDNYANKSLHELEENRFATQKLYGKLACFDDDLPSKKLKNSNKMKKLTGGSDIGAEVKYGGQFDFKNYSKLVFATNEMPKTSDNSDGFFRRWIIQEFPYKFKQNPDEENPLHKQAKNKRDLMNTVTDEKELQGFIWEVVEDLKDVIENNEFTYSSNADQVRNKWREFSKPLTRFIDKYINQGTTFTDAQPSQDESGSISAYNYDYVRKDTLKKLAGLYCKSKSHSEPSKKAIKKALDKSDLLYGIKRTRNEPEDKQVPVYSGLCLELDEEFMEGVQGCRGILSHNRHAHACACKECSNQTLQVCTGESDVKNKLQHIRDLLHEIDNDSLTFGPLISEIKKQSDLKSDTVDKIIGELKKNGEVESLEKGRVKPTKELEV